MRSITVLLVVLGTCWPAPVRADRVRALDLAEVVAKLEKRSPHVKLADAEAESASAALVAARLWPNPTLAYQREEVFAGGDGLADNFITLGWSLDPSGARSRRISAARHGITAAQALAERQKLEAVLAGVAVYLGTAHARLRLEALRKGKEPLRRFLGVLETRSAGGDAAEYDVERLSLELGQQENEIATAITELATARRRLAVLIGEPTTVYDASDSLSLPTVAPKRRIDLRSRPDYRSVAAQLRQADAQLAAARRTWIPTLGFSVGLKTSDLGTETATGYFALLSVSVPLFSRGQAHAARARAARQVALARLNLLSLQIPTQERAALETLQRLVQQARTYEATQVKTAERLVARAESRYRGGAGSIIELVDAYQLAQRVRLRSLDLRLKARRAELDLLRIRGRRPGGK